MNSTVALTIEQDVNLFPISRLLDTAQQELLSAEGPVDWLIDRLVGHLESLRQSLPPDLWARRAQEVVAHPVTHLLHQDPFVRRCFTKPRGYAGDARMLDYIYGEADDDDSTKLGTRLLQATREAPAPRAVRYRKNLLAQAIDRAAVRVDRPRILAVACGHLREARCSQAMQAQRIGELIAFDQDSKSLEVVSRDFRHLGVRTEHGRVRDLIVGRHAVDLVEFDLIYAAGLYDYLREEPARRLTQTLFRMLKPGGTLLIANFLTGIRDRGFMESFMDWHLVYRTMDEIEALTDVLPAHQFSCRRFDDPDRVIGFVEITRV
jgi:SAM-dependent methyltransferase